MAEKFSVSVAGYDQLIHGSEEIFENIADSSSARFESVAAQVASSARGQVPRETGALAASIGTDQDGSAAYVTMGGEDVPYAGWIEFGGSRVGSGGGVAERDYIPEGRYLYPAALDAQPTLEAAALDVAKREIERYSWETPK